jgi:multiple sugar transport system permease protein
MMRNYFETIPRSLEEAAMVDGGSRLVVIWRISLSLAKPAIMASRKGLNHGSAVR